VSEPTQLLINSVADPGFDIGEGVDFANGEGRG